MGEMFNRKSPPLRGVAELPRRLGVEKFIGKLIGANPHQAA
jgi:hypothetical protein